MASLGEPGGAWARDPTDVQERVFSVELNLSRAHDLGLLAGLKLGIDTDASPISVLAVRRRGLVDEWNSAHSGTGNAICVGDKITRANDFLWHLNSVKFARHVMSLYDAGRSLRPGAQGILELEIWRPHLDPQTAALLKKQFEERGASDAAPPEEAVNSTDAQAEEAPAAAEGAEEDNGAGGKPEEELAAAKPEGDAEGAGDTAREEEEEQKEAVEEADEAPVAAKEEKAEDVGDKTEEKEDEENDYTKEEDNAQKDADVKTEDAEEALVAVKKEQEEALDAVKEALVAVKEKKEEVEDDEKDAVDKEAMARDVAKEVVVEEAEGQGASGSAEEIGAAGFGEEGPATGPKAKEELQEYRRQFFPDLDTHTDSQDDAGAPRASPGGAPGAEAPPPLAEGQAQESPEAAARRERNLKKKAEREATEKAKREAALAFKGADEALKKKAEREAKEKDKQEAAWEKEHGAAEAARPRAAAESGKTRSFVAALELPKNSDGLTIAKVLGWKLDVADDSAPITIGKVRREGSVAAWNAANPGKAIGPGDQIKTVNGIRWNHNSMLFADHIAKQFAASQAVASRRLYVEVLQASAGAEDVGAEKSDVASPAGANADAPASKAASASSASQGDREETEAAPPGSGAPQNQAEAARASLDAGAPREDGSQAEEAPSSSEPPRAQSKAGDVVADAGDPEARNGTRAAELMSAIGHIAAAQSAEKFEVALDVPKSMGGLSIAKILGWQLDVAGDSVPLTVHKVRRAGSVAIWNSAHPDHAIRPGDKIVEVNGIPWNHNSMLFADRIAKQFEASQRLASRRLTLKMQRAAEGVGSGPSEVGAAARAEADAPSAETARSSSGGQEDQREAEVASSTSDAPQDQVQRSEAGTDAGVPQASGSAAGATPASPRAQEEGSAAVAPRTDSAAPRGQKETDAVTGKMRSFVATLELPKASGGLTIAKALGWKLDVGDDNVPVTVSKIRREGSVAAWNAANPGQAIRPGDQISGVNGIDWHDNSRIFADHIAKQFAASQAIASRRLLVNVRRAANDHDDDVSRNQNDTSSGRVEADVPSAETTAGSHSMDADANATGDTHLSSDRQRDRTETEEVADSTSEAPQDQTTEDHPIKASLLAAVISTDNASRAVQRKSFVQVDDSSPKHFVAALHVPKFAKGLNIAKALGWKLDVGDDNVPVTVSKIRREGSVAAWNAANPDQAIRPGDQIIKVNGIPWQQDSGTFSEHIAKQFAASQAVSSTHLYLEVQRAPRSAADASSGHVAGVSAAGAARGNSGAREDEKVSSEHVFAEPGCYVRMPAGCVNHHMNTGEWQLDVWAEQAGLAAVAELLCKHRKDSWDSYCGSKSTEMRFVAPKKEAQAAPVALAANPQAATLAADGPADGRVVYQTTPPPPQQQLVEEAAAPPAQKAPEQLQTSNIAQKFEKYLAKKPVLVKEAVVPAEAAALATEPAGLRVASQKPPQPAEPAPAAPVALAAHLQEAVPVEAAPAKAAGLSTGTPAGGNELAEPGCYVRMPAGCNLHPMNTGEWQLDVWAQQVDEAHCAQRKASWDLYCGIESTEMLYVAAGTEGRLAQAQKAAKDADNATSAQNKTNWLVEAAKREAEARRSSGSRGLVKQSLTAMETGTPASFVAALRVPKSNGGDSIAKILGWQLDVEGDGVPITIGKVRRTGSVAAWNAAHPKQAIRAGDQIVKVNGVPWRQNSLLFADRIAKQFQASQEQTNGASRLLYVTVQRAATEDLDGNSSDQSKDVLAAETSAGSHRVDAEANATVDVGATAARTAGLPEAPGCYVRMPSGCSFHPMNTGEWQLDVWVAKAEELACMQRKASWDMYCGINVTEMAFVAPNTAISAPPRQAALVEATPAAEAPPRPPASSIARSFEKYLGPDRPAKDERAAVEASGPGPVAAAPEDVYAAAVELSAGAWQPERAQEFVVPLAVPRTSGPLAKVMGWQLTVEDNQVPPTISKIGDTGPVAQWNAAHPGEAIRPGDQVIEVNGAAWLESRPPFRGLAFIDRIYEAAEASRTSHGAPAPLSIRLRRRAAAALGGPALGAPAAPPAASPLQAEQEARDSEVDRIAKRLDTLFTAWNNQHPEDQISLAMLPSS